MGFFSQAKWRLFDWCVLFGIGGLILAIVVPNFIKARASNHSHSACIPQLRMIQGGVQQWALENKKAATDTHISGLTSFDLPDTSFRNPYVTNPAPMPVVME